MKICGINYEVIEVDDTFNTDAMHFGQIDYAKGKIYINKDLSDDAKQETLCHEILHALLLYIGRQDLTNDEQFVQTLGNVIYQTFIPKEKVCSTM